MPLQLWMSVLHALVIVPFRLYIGYIPFHGTSKSGKPQI